jgi:hypothetical protein
MGTSFMIKGRENASPRFWFGKYLRLLLVGSALYKRDLGKVVTCIRRLDHVTHSNRSGNYLYIYKCTKIMFMEVIEYERIVS